jgi:hypothetical protein
MDHAARRPTGVASAFHVTSFDGRGPSAEQQQCNRFSFSTLPFPIQIKAARAAAQ